MSEMVKDQLSAMLDDELTARESELLVVRLGKDRELRAVWERYSLIGDCIRGSLPRQMAGNLADRVSAALAEDEALTAALPARRPHRWRPVAGVAVAASVAVLALVTLNGPDPVAVGPEPVTSLMSAADSYTVPVVDTREQAAAALRERLNLYHVSHSEFAGPIQRRSLLSHIADVSDDPLPQDTAAESGGRE